MAPLARSSCGEERGRFFDLPTFLEDGAVFGPNMTVRSSVWQPRSLVWVGVTGTWGGGAGGTTPDCLLPSPHWAFRLSIDCVAIASAMIEDASAHPRAASWTTLVAVGLSSPAPPAESSLQALESPHMSTPIRARSIATLEAGDSATAFFLGGGTTGTTKFPRSTSGGEDTVEVCPPARSMVLDADMDLVLRVSTGIRVKDWGSSIPGRPQGGGLVLHVTPSREQRCYPRAPSPRQGGWPWRGSC